MKKYYILVAVLLAGVIASTPVSARNIPFSIDAAQFRYDANSTLWEMYYSFPDTSLSYTRSGKSYVGELYIKTMIFSSHDTVALQEWIITNHRDTLAPTLLKNLVGQKAFLLKPGQYTVDIQIRDVADSTSQARSKFPVIIRDLSGTSLAVSDIEIASSIKPGESAAIGAFKKGELSVVPNPILEYTGTEPELKIYAEAYNTATPSSNKFKAQYTIFDAAKREILAVPLERMASSEGVVETISLPLAIVPSGAYFVKLSIYTPADSPTDSTSILKKFYILNPDMPPEMAPILSEDRLFEMSEFSTMTPERINEEFEMLKYIATLQQIASYNSLSENVARQKFVYRFWAEQDPEPSTPVNEALEEYRRNIAYANTYYSHIQQKDGWRTDRGRILLKHGKPSEITRNNYNVEGRPYEIWYYNNLQGGVEFSFVDMSGYNNYKLVNSTAIGEVRDANWMSRYVIMHPNGEMGR